MEKIPVTILGLSTSPGGSNAYALILKETEGNRRLPIMIGAWEAQCIAVEIEGITPPRPMTHDLIKTIIDQLGSTVTEICISDLRDGTFFASIVLDSNGPEIDARPSDAIAVAVRYGAQIFVEAKVMKEAGFLPEDEEHAQGEEEGDDEEHPLESAAQSLTEKLPQTEKEKIQHQLNEAIAHEDYERAAKLRDQLNLLESN